MARSKGANCQNTNSNLKPQAPKSQPPHSAARGVAQKGRHSKLWSTTGITEREWDPSSLTSFTATSQQGKSLSKLHGAVSLESEALMAGGAAGIVNDNNG